MDLSPETIAQIVGQGVAAVATALALRRGRVRALPAHEEEAPVPVACTCDETTIARAVSAALDDDRIKRLVRQALSEDIERAKRSHDKLDALDLLAILDERTAAIVRAVEAIRSQREQVTPPLGLTR